MDKYCLYTYNRVNVLGMPIDERCGVDSSKQSAEIDPVLKKSLDLHPMCKFREMERIVREALTKYLAVINR